MHLLVAIDLRDDPEAVVDAALGWARQLGGTLDLAHVDDTALAVAFVQDPAARDVLLVEWRERLNRQQSEIEKLMQRVPEAMRGQALVLEGAPATTLIERAESYDAVVIATHGRQGWQRLWLGSVAEKVVRGSPVPVLVLRRAEER